jgi:hypothetical protein
MLSENRNEHTILKFRKAMKTDKTSIPVIPAGPYSPWWPGIKPPRRPDFYLIEVVGCINEGWSEWFHGLKVQCNEKTGITFIHGKVKDQAELFSVLIKIRNLGLSILRLTGNV